MAVASVACGRKTQSEARPPSEAKPASEAPAAESKLEPSSKGAGAGLNSGAGAAPTVEGEQRLPVQFPAVTLTAAVGQQAFAPPEPWLSSALELGVDQQVISLYAAQVEATGAERSTLKSSSGARWTVPNSLVVVLPTAAKVRPGDLVLTHWPQGDSWIRAVVVDGSPEAPLVRYVDLPLDEPSGWGQREQTLSAGSFMKLEKPGQAGTTAACRRSAAPGPAGASPAGAGAAAGESSAGGAAAAMRPAADDKWRRVLVIRTTDSLVLGLGFAGKLGSFARQDCVLIPPGKKLEPGALAQAPQRGVFVPVRILGVGGALSEAASRSAEASAAPQPATADSAPPGAAASAAPAAAAKAPQATAPGRVRVQISGVAAGKGASQVWEVPSLDLALAL